MWAGEAENWTTNVLISRNYALPPESLKFKEISFVLLLLYTSHYICFHIWHTDAEVHYQSSVVCFMFAMHVNIFQCVKLDMLFKKTEPQNQPSGLV